MRCVGLVLLTHRTTPAGNKGLCGGHLSRPAPAQAGQAAGGTLLGRGARPRECGAQPGLRPPPPALPRDHLWAELRLNSPTPPMRGAPGAVWAAWLREAAPTEP